MGPELLPSHVQSCIYPLGVKKKNVLMLDSRGVLNTRRTGLNKYKQEFVRETDADTLEDAMKGR